MWIEAVPIHQTPLSHISPLTVCSLNTDHSVMMDVVTFCITKDHTSQLDGSVRHGSRLHGMKFIKNSSPHRKLFTVKSLCTRTSSNDLCLVCCEIYHIRVKVIHLCICIPVFICVCLWIGNIDQNVEQGSLPSALRESPKSYQRGAAFSARYKILYHPPPISPLLPLLHGAPHFHFPIPLPFLSHLFNNPPTPPNLTYVGHMGKGVPYLATGASMHL